MASLLSALLTVSVFASIAGASAALFPRTQKYQPPCASPYTSFVYSGCYMDSVNSRSLPFMTQIDFNNATIEQCTAACKGNGYRYAGLEYYGQCFCGASVSSAAAPETDCQLACNGNKDQTCGGQDRLSIYQDPTFPDADDIAVSSDYMIVGCYTDDPGDRTLAYSQYDYLNGDTMTTETCLNACGAKGFPFAGTEFGRECYCGVVLGNGTVATAADQCSTACSGNSTEVCGGPQRLSLYVAKNLESTEPCTQGPAPSPSPSTSTPVSTPSPSSSSSSSSTPLSTPSSTSTPSASSTTTPTPSSSRSSTTTPSSSPCTTSSTPARSSTPVSSSTPCTTASSSTVRSSSSSTPTPSSSRSSTPTPTSTPCTTSSTPTSRSSTTSSSSRSSSTLSTLTTSSTARSSSSSSRSSSTTTSATPTTTGGICTTPPAWAGPKCVGNIPMPIVGCNNVASELSQWPFKLFSLADLSSCSKYSWSQSSQACYDACQTQYNRCIDYSNSCKNNNGPENWYTVKTKCSSQYEDCWKANQNVNVASGRCSAGSSNGDQNTSIWDWFSNLFGGWR